MSAPFTTGSQQRPRKAQSNAFNLIRMVVRWRLSGKLLATMAVMAALALGAIDADANLRSVTPSTLVTSPTKVAIPTPTIAGSTDIGNIDPSAMAPIVAPPRDLTVLATAVQQLIASSGATVGVTVVELAGADPVSWSVNGNQVMTAASTYKLAALMREAENIAAGTTDPNGLVCFQDDDYEAGWFDDYADGVCFTRNELALRAGIYSDNTAGHMLVRDVGGADALDAWAASLGATNSAFLVGNTTTSGDLAALWVAETQGAIGGAAAQAWLYPLLTGTRTESGVPAGVPSGVVVVHKTGTIDQVDNDAALVTSGPDGAYLVVVMTDSLGGDAGWQLISDISAQVWEFEASRPQ